MTKVLITGSGSFTASHLIPFLNNIGGLELTGIDTKPGGLITEQCISLLDSIVVQQYLNELRPDIIIHLAAVTKSDNYQDYYNLNVFGTINLLESIVSCGLFETRSLIISSSAVYGNSSAQILTEDTATQPVNFYGSSKVAMEQVALQYVRNYNLNLNIVRPFNIIGGGQPIYFVVPAFAEQLIDIKVKKLEPVIRVGNISPSRDFVDISDVIRAYWIIINSNERGEIFNVGSSSAIKIETLLYTLIEILNVDVDIQPDETRFRKHEIPTQIADISKLSRLGWEPLIPFRESLIRMVSVMQAK